MKPKLILCLALVLSGGLLGCATHTNTTSAFEYPANQDELRLRLAQTIPIKYPNTTATYKVTVYVVQVNDSIASICTHFHKTERELSKLNPDFNLQVIKVGQQIVIDERIE